MIGAGAVYWKGLPNGESPMSNGAGRGQTATPLLHGAHMIKCLHGNSTTLARRAEHTQHSDCVPASAAVAAATAATSVRVHVCNTSVAQCSDSSTVRNALV
eukprot:2065-Heterococcus_DN1.PRE.2